MNVRTDPTIKDQAEGLRALFAAEVPAQQICLLACPQREAAVLPIARALIEAISARNHSLLWIDDVGFRHREGFPLATQVRFQWSQWLDGAVSLSDAVVPFGERRWYAYSGECGSALGARRAGADALRGSGIDADTVLLASGDGQAFLPLFSGRPVHAVLLCDAKPAQLKPALAWIARLEAAGELGSATVLPVGDAKACERFNEALTNVGGGFVASPLEPRDHLDARLLSAPLPTLGRLAAPLVERIATRLLEH